MKVEEVYGDDLITLEELKRIVDEAYAKAPPGTKVIFRGDDWTPEPIRGGLFATHVSGCRSGFLERLTEEGVEKLNQEEGSERRFFKLDVPVFLLSDREPNPAELAVND